MKISGCCGARPKNEWQEMASICGDCQDHCEYEEEVWWYRYINHLQGVKNSNLLLRMRNLSRGIIKRRSYKLKLKYFFSRKMKNNRHAKTF